MKLFYTIITRLCFGYKKPRVIKYKQKIYRENKANPPNYLSPDGLDYPDGSKTN